MDYNRRAIESRLIKRIQSSEIQTYPPPSCLAMPGPGEGERCEQIDCLRRQRQKLAGAGKNKNKQRAKKRMQVTSIRVEPEMISLECAKAASIRDYPVN